MNVTSDATVFQTSNLQVDSKEITLPDVKRKRGRPKGAKNKPKSDNPLPAAVTSENKRGRGRPKGSKNKIKTVQSPASEPQAPTAPPSEIKVLSKVEDSQSTSEEHPLLYAVDWIEKKMHQSQVAYYRSRASRIGSSLQSTIAADILGFFNIQDDPILKQIKKNNFVTI